MIEFFSNNIVVVFFFYGLAFFSMGLAILVEASHTSKLDFAHALPFLAAFGLLHGTHEWFEMFLLNQQLIGSTLAYSWLSPLRLILLAISFILLLTFGIRIILPPSYLQRFPLLLLIIILIWGIGVIWIAFSNPVGQSTTSAMDTYIRYSLAIPGAILTAWGLILQRKNFINIGMFSFARDVTIAAVAFALYGIIGQIFASSNPSFPFNYLNTESFLNLFGFPIQAFRALMACIVAVFIIRTLRAFELENNRRIQNLQQIQQAEQHRVETLRSELLHRTVRAQESERQRIARELHDETGQTLTALGMGLRGVSESIETNPNRAINQTHQLETLAIAGVDELQRMVSGLRPPQLDDLGLVPAIRWFAADITTRYGIVVNVVTQGTRVKLAPDIRTILFRITQEAITNVIRHSGADQIDILIVYKDDEVNLSLEDNGNGFDVNGILAKRSEYTQCWGLLGMQERAKLVGGACNITSNPGEGTRVEVIAPSEGAEKSG
jgi:signal transduction histidine kinase